jgi:two-component system alkaline phosphatase synthesis response regulator PhoP
MDERQDQDVITSGILTLDIGTRTLHRGTERFHVTPKECRLLEVLLRHKGQVLTRQFLMREVWQTDYVADTRTLEVHVHWLRQKIEDNRSNPMYIHTVRGVGYVFRPIETS